MEDVEEFLEAHKDHLKLEESVLKELIECLDFIGVSKLRDLKHVERGNLQVKGLKLHQRKRVLELFENAVQADTQQEFDRENGSIRDFLVFCQLDDEHIDGAETFLEDLGVTELDDLAEVSKEDMESSGLPVIDQNRLMQFICEHLSSPPQQVNRKPAVETKPIAPQPTGEVINVCYIYCNGLFTKDIREKQLVGLDSGRVTMVDLYSMIGEQEQLDGQEMNLELFSFEGYPLNANDFTVDCTLEQWEFEDNYLLFVFPRRKEQPGSMRRKTLPPLDHESGSDELRVNSQFFEDFTVKADLRFDSAEDIAQKVHSYTKIPTPLICLYARKNYQSLDVYTELHSGDQLTLVLKNPAARLKSLATYGKATYNMVVPQSDKGISKFFAILKFLCLKQKETVKFSNLLAYLLQLTSCPPIVYALGVLYHSSTLSLPCWVALIEGFYQLFSAWLGGIWEEFDRKRVFEFSDYFWAIIMKKAEDFRGDTAMVALDKVSLCCPHSGLKITDPVHVPGSRDVYDRQSVFETIERGQKLIGCDKEHLETGHASPDNLVARLLFYNPWDTTKEVHKWRIVTRSSQSKISVAKLPCEWYELALNLPRLQIRAPDALFGLESLTYVEEGVLVLFMGFTKDSEVSHTIYDPLKCDFVKKSKKVFRGISDITKSPAPDMVHEDLTKLVRKIVHLDKDVLLKAKPPRVLTIDPQAAVDWEPEEAIVVLLDRSGSMSFSIFETDAGQLSRLEAAKVFFGAFALRTQAYDFHHSVGLTTFDSIIEKRMPVAKMSPHFEHSLADVTIRGSTELNRAMAEAVEELKIYTANRPRCVRRILCLTDGYDNNNRRYTYSNPYNIASLLQQEKVVVDTVLIDTNAVNVKQKAISHATGGACFMPNSLTEGLALFEMETFLSLRARAQPQNLLRLASEHDYRVFENTSRYPFNTDLLPSVLFEQVKSLSTQRMMEAQDMFDSKSEASECTQRVLREIREINRNPVPYLDVFPSEQSYTTWRVLMKGPEATPYAGGTFILRVLFPDNYPSKPPNIRFETPIYHCNINSYGRICHQVFTLGYTPSLTMRDILACVYGLMMCPEPSDPLDSLKGLELYNSMREEARGFEGVSEYKKAAKAHTEKHAKRNNYEMLKKELSGV